MIETRWVLIAGACVASVPNAVDTDYFAPSSKPFMVNLAVDDLAGVLERAREHGVEPVRTFDDQANGRFAHIVDPDGTTLELWEPAPMA